MPPIHQLLNALHAAWTADTSYAKTGEWSIDNPARGQCVTSALVVQDYFGGDIVRYAVTGDGIDETHYLNLLDDGTLLDTTGSQYKDSVSMRLKPIDLAKNNFISVRQRCLADKETKYRYELLKKRVENSLREFEK